MARASRSPKLESRTSRLKLPIARKPIFVRVAPGVSLGYRRNETAGTWVLRIANGRGGSQTQRIGSADDHQEHDGQAVLTFWEAQEQARTIACSGSKSSGKKAALKVELAVDAYLLGLETRNPRTAYVARCRLRRLFLPRFGTKQINELTRRDLEAWRE